MVNKATIRHIEFWVTDLKSSISFYTNIFHILKWKKIEKNAFSNGETKIYFVEQKVKLLKTVGPRHICFLANSSKIVDDVGQFLINSGYVVIRGPLISHYKNRSSYTVDFRDPDGYILEVATKSIVSIKRVAI
jgi:catechol 2,3-dioxygenase-like lactoylglutathione lyase family enzyme